MTQGALSQLPNLEYIKTVTTKPPRKDSDRTSSYEYEFVSEDEYQRRKEAASEWDHSFIYNASYGCDSSVYQKKLEEGTNLIINTLPDNSEIENLKRIYGSASGGIAVIFIDTPHIESEKIIYSERPDFESIRVEEDSKRERFMGYDELFVPERSIESDSKRFNELIIRILK